MNKTHSAVDKHHDRKEHSDALLRKYANDKLEMHNVSWVVRIVTAEVHKNMQIMFGVHN